MTTGSNRLAVLAAEIQDADGRVRRSAEEAAAAALDAGHRLIEAKALLPHGKWLPWLKDHAGISDRTARRYMQIAKSGMEIGHVADLGIRGAAQAAAKRRVPRDTEASAIEDAVVVWWKMLIRFSHLAPKDRERQRLKFLDTIAAGDESGRLMQMYVRHTREIEEALTKEGALPGADWSDEELDVRVKDALRQAAPSPLTALRGVQNGQFL